MCCGIYLYLHSSVIKCIQPSAQNRSKPMDCAFTLCFDPLIETGTFTWRKAQNSRLFIPPILYQQPDWSPGLAIGSCRIESRHGLAESAGSQNH